jgi:hypothetical protein
MGNGEDILGSDGGEMKKRSVLLLAQTGNHNKLFKEKNEKLLDTDIA